MPKPYRTVNTIAMRQEASLVRYAAFQERVMREPDMIRRMRLTLDKLERKVNDGDLDV